MARLSISVIRLELSKSDAAANYDNAESSGADYQDNLFKIAARGEAVLERVKKGTGFAASLSADSEGRMSVFVSTDKSLLDLEMIHKFLSEESYWAQRRTKDQTQTAIENSICFGLYNGERQIGFARVISDRATYAYLGDVFVLSEFRGRGYSKMLMEAVVSHPDLQGLRRWTLATKDAHGLYKQFGFAPLRLPERWMERTAPDAYLSSVDDSQS